MKNELGSLKTQLDDILIQQLKYNTFQYTNKTGNTKNNNYHSYQLRGNA